MNCLISLTLMVTARAKATREKKLGDYKLYLN